MVFHVGIDFHRGIADVYDSTSKITKSDIIVRQNPQFNEEGIHISFKIIQDKLNGGNLGNACVYLGDNDVKNDIRKYICEKGKECGFLKVQIIDFYAVEYLKNMCGEYLKKDSTYKPNEGDIIWTHGDECLNWIIYEVNNKKAKAVKFLATPFFDWTVESLLKIKNDSGVEKNPSYIFINQETTAANQQSMLNLIQVLFHECKGILIEPYRRNYYPKSDSALLKARIMAKDPELLRYEVHAHIGKNLNFAINEKKIFTFNNLELLPSEKTIFVNGKSIEKMTIIRKGEIPPDKITNYPKNMKMQLKLTVDENNIFCVDYVPISCSSVTLCNKYVTIYNSKTKILKKFPATIDYGFNPHKVGVNYSSPTVIDYFGNQIDGEKYVKTRAIYLLNQVNVYFVLYIDGTKSLIDKKRVIADLLRGAAKYVDDIDKIVHFTIPPHLSESEYSSVLQAAKAAGYNSIEIVEEQVALANVELCTHEDELRRHKRKRFIGPLLDLVFQENQDQDPQG